MFQTAGLLSSIIGNQKSMSDIIHIHSSKIETCIMQAIEKLPSDSAKPVSGCRNNLINNLNMGHTILQKKHV